MFQLKVYSFFFFCFKYINKTKEINKLIGRLHTKKEPVPTYQPGVFGK